MKIVNRNGKVLLEVTKAEWINNIVGDRVGYCYRGDGCGGFTDIVGLQRQYECIKTWSKTARIEGELPEPLVRP